MKGMVLQRLFIALGLGLLLAGSAAAQPATPNLQRLHDALHLTADQEPAWRAYAAAIVPTSAAQTRHQQAEQLIPQLPTPRRIALIEATMSADQADFHRQGQAVVHFYDQLAPAQQRVFDSETMGPGPARGASGSGALLRTPPNG